MIITSREVPAVPASLKEIIENDIRSALNGIATRDGKFIVNDRVVFRPKYEDGRLVKATRHAFSTKPTSCRALSKRIW